MPKANDPEQLSRADIPGLENLFGARVKTQAELDAHLKSIPPLEPADTPEKLYRWINAVEFWLDRRDEGWHRDDLRTVLFDARRYADRMLQKTPSLPALPLANERGEIELRNLKLWAQQAELEKPLTKNKPTLAKLQSKTPPLDTGNGQWIKNKNAAALDGVETATLKAYRYNGEVTKDKLFGRDADGRVWRKVGKNATPFYLASTLKSRKQKP